jgi:hypothetical protein
MSVCDVCLVAMLVCDKQHNSFSLSFCIFSIRAPFAAFYVNMFFPSLLLCSTFSQCSYLKSTDCPLFNTCTVSVVYLYSTCTVSVVYLYSTCTVSVVYLYSNCTVSVVYLYSTCTVSVVYLQLV